MAFPVITQAIQQEYERRYPVAPSGMTMICGCHGRACRQLENPEGANRATCQSCPLAAYAAGTRPVKLIEHTNGTHIFMRLQLLSGRIEEIDVYLRPDGSSHYVTTADHDLPRRREAIEVFNALY